jgi:hypothetical protein
MSQPQPQDPVLPKDAAKCVPPIAVPTHGPGGVFSVACSTTISAPALSCVEKVLDFPSYEKWNTFVPSASVIEPAPAAAPAQGREGNEEDDDAHDDPFAKQRRGSGVAPGAKIRFNVVMTPGSSNGPRAVDLEVTVLETFAGEGNGKGYRVAWKVMGLPRFLLRSERVQEFVEHLTTEGKVETRYRCWETFGGALGYVLPKSQLEDGFTRWTDSLKRAVESENA